MDTRSENFGGLFEVINGGHLHWSEFRENVLQSFRIKCTASSKADELPTTFLARLKAAQKNLGQHDVQREAWRLEALAGTGLTSSAVFPPNLVPHRNESSKSLRLMIPQMSREGLPLRSPGALGTLYELPTAKPVYVFGFDMETFTKSEQAQLSGPLQVTGVSVDFAKGEVLPARSLCCPYLAFERFTLNSEQCIETARNSCAVTGAQCLRGQQQLFHKAFGLQTVSQPPITFTCALNNEHAVINLHYTDEDGDYNMAALCKFDLQNDAHFNTFQAWIEAIDSWAALYLLPRIQGAIAQVVHSYPSPPPSPTPTNSSHLSIDTKSSNVFSIVKELRHIYPTIPWRKDQSGETPINSSVAQCGTPLPTREIRSQALSRPTNSGGSSPVDEHGGGKQTSFVSPNLSEVLSPIHTNLPLSGRNRPRSSSQQRFVFSPGRASFPMSDRSSTPISPCRPASLSPCTPGPEMPTSSMNPMLVLRRRLDVACTEILELRLQVDDLQGQLNDRTDKLEQRLRAMSERQDKADAFAGGNASAHRYCDGWAKPVEDMTEQEMRTPTASNPSPNQMYNSEYHAGPSLSVEGMPGHYDHKDDEEALFDWSWPTLAVDQDFAVWCLAKLLKDNNTQFSLLLCFTFIMYCLGRLHGGEFGLNTVIMAAADNQYGAPMIWTWYDFLMSFYEAARDLALEDACDGVKVLDENYKEYDTGSERTESHEKDTVHDDGGGEAIQIFVEQADGEDMATECVPIVLY